MEASDDIGDDALEDRLPSSDESGDWAELRQEVFDTAILRELCGDGVPLMKIGRFDGLRWIGEGGFGVVFKAIDPKLGRLVALKLCRTKSPDAIEAIEREGRALAQLHHAHIVPVFELGEHDGGVFIAMQYIDGCDAHQFGLRNPRPSWQKIVEIYCQVGRGLAAAHAAGFVHGDIKPSNILLDQLDFAFLVDFGLAQKIIYLVPESERDGLRRRAGTLPYMAPEVLTGQAVDERSDQFSLCVALVHTLLGEAPFKGQTSGAVFDDIALHLDDILERIQPKRLRDVLRRGLSMNPRDRFPNVSELVAALQRTIDPKVELSPRGFAELVPSRAARLSFAVGAVLVGTLGLAVGWMGRGRVEAEVARVSEPVLRVATSPCAVEATDPDVSNHVLEITCSRIREGKLFDAARLWDLEMTSRRYPPGGSEPTDEDLALLRAQTLVVARTFDEQAKQYRRWDLVSRTIRWTAKVLGRPVPEDPAVLSADNANECRAHLEGLPKPE